MIDVVIEVYETSHRKSLTSLYSFVSKNKWFNGKLWILTNSDDHISPQTKISIQKIYYNIEVINTTLDSDFIEYLGDNVNNPSLVKLKSILIDCQRVLYFSNTSLFLSNIEYLIRPRTSFTASDASVFYLDLPNHKAASIKDSFNVENPIDVLLKLPLMSIMSEDTIIQASSIPDDLYTRSSEKLAASNIISFDIFKSNFTKSTRITSIWLHSTREVNSILSSPISMRVKNKPVYTALAKSGPPVSTGELYNAPKSHLTSVKPEIRLISLANFAKELENKSICLVANSSDLLNYENGEYIDSHDIVIRFNSFTLNTLHTGQKTSIHAAIYLESYNLDIKTEYRIIISNSKRNWVKAVNQLSPTSQDYILDVNWPLGLINSDDYSSNKVPTTGFNLILLLYNFIQYSKVSLVGFTFYNDGLSSIYRHKSIVPHISKVHNYNFEEKWINSVFLNTNNNIFIHEKGNTL